MKMNKAAVKVLSMIFIAVAIVGIFVAFLYVERIDKRKEEALQLAVENEISMIILSLDMYKYDYGVYPINSQGLMVLVETLLRKSGKKYLPDNSLLKDPWGNSYKYRYSVRDNQFEIVSFGADGKAGGKGINKDIKRTGGGR